MSQDDNQSNQDPQQQETIEVADLDTFVRLIVGWHTRGVRTLRHFRHIPPGTEMEVNGEAVGKLEGDVLRGFIAGLDFALTELGTLPFAAELESVEDSGAQGDNPASNAVQSGNEPPKVH